MHCRFKQLLNKVTASANGKDVNQSPLATVDETEELTKEQFKMLLEKVDSGLRALPATAQVGHTALDTCL